MRIKELEKQLNYKIELIEESILAMKKDISRIDSHLKAHINRQFCEIRVLEDSWNEDCDVIIGGVKKRWGDYSGVFYSDDRDEEKVIVEKAKKHFDKYFKGGVFHLNKTLGIFLTSPRGGKRLIEELKTGEQ